MSQIQVVPAKTRREKRDFVDLPWRLYRDYPYWIPPLRMSVKELVGFARHPFHEHNQVQPYVAYRDGQAVGRIAAIVNQGHIDRYHDPRGFFGFFEAENDQAIATALFDQVKAWLAERGLKDMRGPTNPSLNYEIGLLIEGFDSTPYFMMTYNPPYYAELIERYGFRKAQDLFAYWGHVEMLGKLDKKLLFIIEESTRRFDVKMRQMDKRRFYEEVRTFLGIYNESLGGTWGYTPLSPGEIDHIAKALRMLIVPELTSVAEVNGKVVGAAFGLLDYNPRIKKINGRLFPFGFIRLLWNKQGINRMRLVSTNVIPQFQRWGLGLLLMAQLVKPSMDWGIDEAEFSWVLESNILSGGSLERGGAKRTKTYRLYDYGDTPDPQRGMGARARLK